MDYETYQKRFFVSPQPEQRFQFEGIMGITLFFAEYENAVGYYTAVLGPPAYVEGTGTRGWQLGNTWLTLLKGEAQQHSNVEIQIIMQTPTEAERLQKAFIDAGGSGAEPTNELMYYPVRYCPLTDPFGTDILVYAMIQ
ncbi:MAG: hypothetical protein AAF490_26595 [Chloroflexota bacterium]